MLSNLWWPDSREETSHYLYTDRRTLCVMPLNERRCGIIECKKLTKVKIEIRKDLITNKQLNYLRQSSNCISMEYNFKFKKIAKDFYKKFSRLHYVEKKFTVIESRIVSSMIQIVFGVQLSSRYCRWICNILFQKCFKRNTTNLDNLVRIHHKSICQSLPITILLKIVFFTERCFDFEQSLKTTFNSNSSSKSSISFKSFNKISSFM